MKSHHNQQPPSKWLSPTEASKIYNISKSRLYELLAEGAIPSVSIKKRNARRGLRRISVEALDAYFADLQESQNPPAAEDETTEE